jgi:hypothetical protein
MSAPMVADTLQLGHGIDRAELERVIAELGRLDAGLRSFPAGVVELWLGVKQRDTPSQRTTLGAWVAGQTRLVATSNRTDLDVAAAEVRDDRVPQTTDARNRTERRGNRFRRPGR